MTHSRILDPLLAESTLAGRFDWSALSPWLPPGGDHHASHPPGALSGLRAAY